MDRIYMLAIDSWVIGMIQLPRMKEIGWRIVMERGEVACNMAHTKIQFVVESVRGKLMGCDTSQ